MLVNGGEITVEAVECQHTGNGQLALTLQESSISSDELLRLITKDPISNYSVVRSLATPSRLLLDPSKNFFLFIYLYIPHSFTACMSSVRDLGSWYFSTQAAVALRRRP